MSGPIQTKTLSSVRREKERSSGTEVNSVQKSEPSLWEQAFDELSQNDKNELQNSRDEPASDPSSVVKAVTDKKDECVKKQWTLYTNKQGEKVLVRDVLTKVSDWIDTFKQIGDAAVQYDPGHASIPWAAVRMLLQLTVNDCQTFGSMLESVEAVSSIVARYTALETRVLIRSSVLSKQLSAALIQLYGAVLKYLARARHYYAKSTLGRALKSTISSVQSSVKEPMLVIEKYETDVFKLVLLVQNECTGIKLEDILDGIKQNINNIQASKEKRRRRLAAWINGIDTRNTYETALQYHHDGTCQWTLELQELQGWQIEDTSKGGLLWIHGPPGFGKTFMSAWIIRHLKETSHLPVSFFFCVADNQPTRDPYAILRSWLLQALEQDDTALGVMNSLYTAGNKDQILTHIELWELFVAVGEAVPGCIFVVDGFDECIDIDAGARYHRNDPRNHFLRDMTKALAKSKCRILVVSRDVPDIREFVGKNSVDIPGVETFEYQITAKDTTADVQSFSEFVVNEKLKKRKKPSLIQEIADQAAERSKGMFLWIRLLENEISPGQNAKQLSTTVQDMPSGISEAYSRELERIAQLPSKDKDMAIMILRWVLFAVRPLLVKELAEALLISDEGLEKYPEDDEFPDEWHEEFVNEDYVNEQILGRCGSLLQLRSKSGGVPLADQTVHFVHFSVKEYISSLSSGFSKSPLASSLGLADGAAEEIRISNICLRYLTLNVFKEIPQKTSLYPFLSYASWAWYIHSFHKKPTPPSQDTLHRTQKAFDPTASTWRVWTPLMEAELTDPAKEWEKTTESDSDEDSDGESSTSSDSATLVDKINDKLEATVQNPIYYASLLGLVDVLKWLESQGLDCNCTGGRLGSPLQAAVARNQEVVVKYLLNRNVDTNQQGGQYGSAIIAAAVLSSPDITNMLIGAGANVASADEMGWTALHYAARRGSAEIVKRLLDNTAQVDSVTGNGITAAMLACLHGHRDVFSVLITGGANVELADENGLTPFQYALYQCHEGLALTLLDTMSTSSTSTLCKSQPYHWAIRAGSLEVVEKLLSKKIDTEILDEKNWTALQLAAALGEVKIVEALIQAGADIACSHLGKPSPIQMAAANSRVSVIKALHKHGIDLNQTSRNGLNALLMAVSNGDQETVEALLDLGARIQCIWESTQETLIDIAIRARNEEIGMLLVSRGCFRIHGQTYTAAEDSLPMLANKCDEKAITDLLQTTGNSLTTADLNEALHVASVRSEKNIVQLLLTNGASVNAKDINGRSALHYAAMHSKFDTADVLIERGASVFVEDNIGSTPIDLAVLRGLKSVEFIRKHMDDLTLSIIRRPSLLNAVGENGSSSSPLDVRKAISGPLAGHYDYLRWEDGRKDDFSITIPAMLPESARPNTFSSEHEHDSIGDFQYHGFVDQIGIIWFVKLYQAHGWLYRGKYDADKRTIKGTWGSNRKLWFGTFELTLAPDALAGLA